MTNEDLKALCEKWQILLGLRGWDIRIRFVEIKEMGDIYNTGHMEYDRIRKRAVVTICHDARHEFPEFGLYSVEYLVAHELAHLVLAGCKIEDSDAEETAAVQISSALAKLALEVK